jgi:hypothetical protein
LESEIECSEDAVLLEIDDARDEKVSVSLENENWTDFLELELRGVESDDAESKVGEDGDNAVGAVAVEEYSSVEKVCSEEADDNEDVVDANDDELEVCCGVTDTISGGSANDEPGMRVDLRRSKGGFFSLESDDLRRSKDGFLRKGGGTSPSSESESDDDDEGSEIAGLEASTALCNKIDGAT